MNAKERAELLARYRRAPTLLAESVAGVSLAQLDGKPPEPGWTARQTVHHVSDIAIMGALRLRMMLVDIEVEYWPYEQDTLQNRLRYRKRAVGPAVRTVEALVESSAAILDTLREDEWLATPPHPRQRLPQHRRLAPGQHPPHRRTRRSDPLRPDRNVLGESGDAT